MLARHLMLEWLLRHVEGNRNPRSERARLSNVLVLPRDIQANWNVTTKPGTPAAALPMNSLEAGTHLLAIQVGLNRTTAHAAEP